MVKLYFRVQKQETAVPDAECDCMHMFCRLMPIYWATRFLMLSVAAILDVQEIVMEIFLINQLIGR